MNPLNAADSRHLARLAAQQAAKALTAWTDARDAAYHLAAQAIAAGADREAVIEPLRGLCTGEQLEALAALR